MTRRIVLDALRDLALAVVLCGLVVACWAVGLPWLARLAVMGVRP